MPSGVFANRLKVSSLEKNLTSLGNRGRYPPKRFLLITNQMLYQLSYASLKDRHGWSGVRESNPCKSAWKADAQPLGQPRARNRTATATIVRNGGECGQFTQRAPKPDL